MDPKQSTEREITATDPATLPDYSWDGVGSLDFSGHSKVDGNAKEPEFLSYLASLHSHPIMFKFEGLEPYHGNKRQVMLDIEYRESRIPPRMCSWDQAYFSDRPWRVTDLKPVKRNVFRATLHVHGDQNVEVALKFGVGYDAKDALEQEAIMYVEKLARLQGKVIPQYLGIFCATYTRKDHVNPLVKTCLMLTWVGRSLPCPIKKLEDAELR
jgi:hypothetical protein